MEVDVALVPSQARAWRGTVCIGIDELRASSTITTLLDRGCRDLFLTDTLAEARGIARATGSLLVGERHGRIPRGFDFNNSPAELRYAPIRGRGVILCTTNGTYILSRLQRMAVTLVGCLLNARACAEAAFDFAQARGCGIGIVCAGTEGRFALDDAVAAGVMVDDLLDVAREHGAACYLSDAALGVVRLRSSYDDLTVALNESVAGRLVTELGAADDVTLCAQLDSSRTVPIVRPGRPLSIGRLGGHPTHGGGHGGRAAGSEGAP